MTIPFNLIIIVSFLNFQSEDYSPLSSGTSSMNSSAIDWTRVMEGSVLSLGQVYAIQGLTTSIFMWIALALYSPLLAILSALGAVLGSFLPLAFLDPESYKSVYSGLWGYNCILSVVAVAWACFSFSWSVSYPFLRYHLNFYFRKALFAGVVNGVTTVFVQKSLQVTLSKVSIHKYDIVFYLSADM